MSMSTDDQTTTPGTGTANAAGGSTSTPDPGQAGQDPQPGQAGQGDPDSGDEAQNAATFSQAQVDQIVKDRLERERKKAAAEADQAKKQAEEAALAERQEFKELADRRQAQITELEAQRDKLTEELEASNAALQSYLDALIQGVPDNIKALLEGRSLPDQLSWLAANRESIVPGGDSSRSPLPSTPSGHKGNEQLTEAQRREQAYRVRL